MKHLFGCTFSFLQKQRYNFCLILQVKYLRADGQSLRAHAYYTGAVANYRCAGAKYLRGGAKKPNCGFGMRTAVGEVLLTGNRAESQAGYLFVTLAG